MTCTFRLDLADLTVRTTLSGDVAPDRIEHRFSSYLRADARWAPADLTLDLVIDEALDLPQPAGVPYPGCTGTRGPDGRIHFARLGLALEFDPRTGRAHGKSHPSNHRLTPDEDGTPLDTPLRLLLSYVLPDHGGLLLHASGYGDARGAVIFAGASGAGKTTTARKLPPPHVLSDDQVAVRKRGGHWEAFALPFVGEYARPTRSRHAPLRRLYLLDRSGWAGAPPAKRTLLARLMACIPCFVLGDPKTAGLLDLAADLLRTVPAAPLRLEREQPIAPLLEEALACP